VLPRARRIRRTEDFRAVLRGPGRAATPTLVVHAGYLPVGEDADPRAPHPPARAGFVVNRAVGGSVVRHRVTRQLRHLTARRLVEVPDGVGLVVRALPAAADATSDTLARDLARGFARAVRTLGPGPGTRSAVTQ
jgi:ribonuclease P protein component